jgi:hypothetical protein
MSRSALKKDIKCRVDQAQRIHREKHAESLVDPLCLIHPTVVRQGDMG